jgi:isoquinoline 1-oxidoreductase alpha subunit
MVTRSTFYFHKKICCVWRILHGLVQPDPPRGLQCAWPGHRFHFLCPQTKPGRWDRQRIENFLIPLPQRIFMPAFTLNGNATTLDLPDDMPLLWAIRDVVGLTGTKFGCGIAQCGACTVHVEGQAVRSCVTPLSAVAGKKVLTIEAMDKDPVGQKVQAAWREIDVVQCGYCQSGQVMSATALLHATPNPSDADIDTAMAGNICRCGTYGRIRAAIKIAAAKPAPQESRS